MNGRGRGLAKLHLAENGDMDGKDCVKVQGSLAKLGLDNVLFCSHAVIIPVLSDCESSVSHRPNLSMCDLIHAET